LSRQEYLLEDPVGLPDFTLPVAIVAQLVESLAVDIRAQSVGNLRVDIAAQSLTQLNVNIVAQAVDIRVTNALDVSGNPIPLKIDIAAQSTTLNVNIAGSSVTLNVNITAQSITLNTSISDAIANLTVTMLFTKGNRVIASVRVQSGSVTLYTCPDGKLAFVIAMSWSAFNTAPSGTDYFRVNIVSGTATHLLVYKTINAGERESDIVTGGLAILKAGESLVVKAGLRVDVTITAIIVEV
jgi:hypothetical protein